MQIYTMYGIKIKHYNNIFRDTVSIYRSAVGYLITICLDNWDEISLLKGKNKLSYIESITHATKNNPHPKYDIDAKFYQCRRKAPCFSYGDIRRPLFII